MHRLHHPDSPRELEAHARWLAAEGRYDEALGAIHAAIEQDPTSVPRITFAAELLTDNHRCAEAIDLLQESAARNPSQSWPFAIMAQVLAHALERDGLSADSEVETLLQQAYEIAELPESSNTGEIIRQLLRKLNYWPQLARHLEGQVHATLRVADWISLHEELIEVLTSRLGDVTTARQIQQRAQGFSDMPALIAGYWSTLTERPSDPAAMQQAEAFFRANGLWSELGQLLENKISTSNIEASLVTAQEIFLLYSGLPTAPWLRFLEKLQTLEKSVPTKEARSEYHALLLRIEQRIQEEPTAGTGWVLWLAGGAAISFGMLLMFFWLSLS